MGKPDPLLCIASLSNGKRSPIKIYETGNTQSVLDGDLDALMEAYLRQSGS